MFIYNHNIEKTRYGYVHVEFTSLSFQVNSHCLFEKLFFNMYDNQHHYKILKNTLITNKGRELITYIETLYGISSFTLYKHETIHNTFCMDIRIELSLVPADEIIRTLDILFYESDMDSFFRKARSLKRYVNRDYFYFDKKEYPTHLDIILTFANVITKNKRYFKINSLENINRIHFTRFGYKYIYNYLLSLQRNYQLYRHFKLVKISPYQINIIFRNETIINIIMQGFTMGAFDQFTIHQYTESPVLHNNMNQYLE